LPAIPARPFAAARLLLLAAPLLLAPALHADEATAASVMASSAAYDSPDYSSTPGSKLDGSGPAVDSPRSGNDSDSSAAKQAGPTAAPKLEMLWELDAYYSSLCLQVPLTNKPLPDGGDLAESAVYKQLFFDSLRPRVLMLEASVYPLPAAGTWFKSHHPDSYDNFDVGEIGNNQLNLIDGVTAGFQEPWAVSAFTGSAMQFTRPGHGASSSASDSNRGYMGYLVSYGAKHIRNNVLIDDNWWELEWKLKGERDFSEEELSWSFRLGLKTHGNRNIKDVAYLGLRRSNLDYQGPLLALLNNSNLEMLTEIDRHSGRFLRQEITVGRKFPLPSHHVALTLDIGLIYESDDKYSGPLSDPTADAFTIVFRPNIQF
jgi:hypothetical protein